MFGVGVSSSLIWQREQRRKGSEETVELCVLMLLLEEFVDPLSDILGRGFEEVSIVGIQLDVQTG
jgi:hypothetical protein